MVAASIFMKAIGMACLAGAPVMASPARALRAMHNSHGVCAHGEYRQQYEQCGGSYYTGCGQCVTGLECVGDNWYKQCQQTAGLYEGAQCGGQHYRGPMRCAPHLACTWRSSSYSECATPEYTRGGRGSDTHGAPQLAVGVPAGAPEVAMADAGSPAGAPEATEADAPMAATARRRRLASVGAGDAPAPASAATALPVGDAPAAAPEVFTAATAERGAGAGAPSVAHAFAAPPLPPPPPAQVAGSWEQCGGKGYAGPEQCTPGYVCKKFSMYWSQCVYDTMPSEGLPLWAQCGGKGYPGPSKCAEPGFCKYDNLYYSQCVPK